MAAHPFRDLVIFTFAILVGVTADAARADEVGADGRSLFQRGAVITPARGPNIFITPENIPENDHFLNVYSTDRLYRRQSDAKAAPGLLGVAGQTYRAGAGDGTAGSAYTLADAMRDAAWRQRTAAKLRTFTAGRRQCGEGVAPSQHTGMFDTPWSHC